MPRELEVNFRGDELVVVVDQYEYDPETNGLDVEWHFKHLTPEQHDALNITDKEEDAIIEQISENAYDRSDDSALDWYDYKEDR